MQQNGKRNKARTRKRKFVEVENEVLEKITRDYAIEENKMKKDIKKKKKHNKKEKKEIKNSKEDNERMK